MVLSEGIINGSSVLRDAEAVHSELLPGVRARFGDRGLSGDIVVSDADEPDPKKSGHLVAGRLVIPMSELEFTYARSSGPGGQNVNKVNSKAQLRWRVTEATSLPPEVRERFLALHRRRMTSEGDLLLSSQRSRDQKRNVDDCLAKLRELLLAAAARPKRRKKTKPSRSSIERRLKAKRSRSTRKEGRREPRMED